MRRGGIYAHSVYGESHIELLLVNYLVYENQAEWTGGGIQLGASEVDDNNTIHATIINSTICNNWLNSYTGIWGRGAGINIFAYEGIGAIASADIYKSIIYGNTMSGSEAQDLCFGEDEPGNTIVNAKFCNIGDVLIILLMAWVHHDIESR
jgi:hypothetical protein